MRRLIGLIGYARTGKDTVADYLVSQHEFVRLASGDLVRDVLYAANPIIDNGGWRLQPMVNHRGWEAAKAHPEVRRLLQELGTEGVRKTLGDDVWIDETLRRAATCPTDVVITDTRFPNEAAKVRAKGGLLVRIDRPGVGPLNAHASESHIPHIPVDHVINNDGTLEDLYARIDGVLAVTRPIPYDPWPGAPVSRPGDLHGERHYTGGPLHIDVI